MARRFLLLALVTLTACATSMTPSANTRDEIVAYVDRAAELVRTRGAVCDTLVAAPWTAGEWYVFVFDSGGRTLCHPIAAQIGVPASELVDRGGKRFGEELLRVAAAGGGWVEYMWPRPGETAPVAKSAYVREVTGPDGRRYVIGSGGYPER